MSQEETPVAQRWRLEPTLGVVSAVVSGRENNLNAVEQGGSAYTQNAFERRTRGVGKRLSRVEQDRDAIIVDDDNAHQ